MAQPPGEVRRRGASKRCYLARAGPGQLAGSVDPCLAGPGFLLQLVTFLLQAEAPGRSPGLSSDRGHMLGASAPCLPPLALRNRPGFLRPCAKLPLPLCPCGCVSRCCPWKPRVTSCTASSAFPLPPLRSGVWKGSHVVAARLGVYCGHRKARPVWAEVYRNLDGGTQRLGGSGS